MPSATIDYHGVGAKVDNAGKWQLIVKDKRSKEWLDLLLKRLHDLSERIKPTPADGEPCAVYAEAAVKLLGKEAKIIQVKYSKVPDGTVF